MTWSKWETVTSEETTSGLLMEIWTSSHFCKSLLSKVTSLVILEYYSGCWLDWPCWWQSQLVLDSDGRRCFRRSTFLTSSGRVLLWLATGWAAAGISQKSDWCWPHQPWHRAYHQGSKSGNCRDQCLVTEKIAVPFSETHYFFVVSFFPHCLYSSLNSLK